jgi:tyrosine-protein kinase Etk/Wzc
MNTNNPEEFENPSFVENEEPAFNIRELIGKYIFHWPVFIVGIAICLTLAFFYLRYTPEVYAVKGTLLIKDQKKGSGIAGDDLLTEIDLFGSSKVVDNEIEILKSKTLMHRVVNRLNLMIGYHIEGRVTQKDIYATKPVNIGVLEMDSTYYGKVLNLSFPTSTTYLLIDELGGKKVKGRLGQLQRTSFGVFNIEPNDNLING